MGEESNYVEENKQYEKIRFQMMCLGETPSQLREGGRGRGGKGKGREEGTYFRWSGQGRSPSGGYI